jgi:hypothetical protein
MALNSAFNAGGHRYLYDRGRYKRWGSQGSMSSLKGTGGTPPPLANQVADGRGGVDMSQDKRSSEAREAGMQPYQDFMFVKQKTVK